MQLALQRIQFGPRGLVQHCAQCRASMSMRKECFDLGYLSRALCTSYGKVKQVEEPHSVAFTMRKIKASYIRPVIRLYEVSYSFLIARHPFLPFRRGRGLLNLKTKVAEKLITQAILAPVTKIIMMLIVPLSCPLNH